MKTTSSRKDTLRGVLGYVGRYRGYLVASMALCVITVASTLYVPILTGNAVDLLLGPGAVDFAALWPILAGILALVALTALAQWLMGLCNNRLTYCTVRDIRHDAFAHIQRLPLSYLDRQPTGDVVSRVIADVDQFADGLLMGFTQLFTGVLTIVGTLFFMFSVNRGGGGGHHAAEPAGGGLYRPPHVQDVHAANPYARRADRAHRRDGDPSEGGARLLHGG